MGGCLSVPITSLFVERVGSKLCRAAVGTLQGWRPTQEDAHNLCTKLNDHNVMLFGVYDGHGGKLAAQYLSKTMPAAFAEITIVDESQNERIKDIMLDIDAQFMKTRSEDGSTCTFVLAQPWNMATDTPILDQDAIEKIYTTPDCALKLLAVNIGDSRSMIVRGDGSWVAMTRDHKPTDEVERCRINNAWGHITNGRVDGNLALSRAIGDVAYKKNTNLPPEKQKVIAVPDTQSHFLYPGDILLVCCDGIFESDNMTYDVVASVVHDSVAILSANGNLWDPAVVCRNLIERSLSSESRDNHTAAVLHFADGTDYVLSDTSDTGYVESEVIPGPYNSSGDDPTFKKAYEDNLIENGYTLDQVLPAILAFENNRIHDDIKPIEYNANKSNEGQVGGFDTVMMNHFIRLLGSKSNLEANEDDEE